MRHRIDIRGAMVPNDYKWYYDLLEMECTCPMDVKKVINAMQTGDEVEIYINSPGGVIDVGSEIYTMLREIEGAKAYITGEACSAASIVAMATYCEMSPTALMMVHCVSSGARGNHSTMEHMAEVLRTADRALCRAYMEKAGMSEQEALEMMEQETWLTAEQARERGLVDAIMFEEEAEKMPYVAGPLFALPSEEQMQMAKRMIKEAEVSKDDISAFLMQQKLNLLKLKGEKR